MARAIHPTAIVDRHAELDEDVTIGPYAVVGAHVRIGARTAIGAHVVVDGASSLGEDNVVHPFAVVGGVAQSKRASTKTGRLEIGDANVLREHVTVHAGTDGRATRIGSHGLFMVGAHVAHDAVVGSHVALANGVQIAGHCEIGDHATFGGLSGVAQFVRVGESAFVAAGAMCEADVPPFVIVQGDRARVRAVNRVGLRRRGVAESSIAALDRAVRALFGGKTPRAVALRTIPRDDPYVTRLATWLDSLSDP